MNRLRSPFPGMDPFLENPPRWKGVHTRLIVEISNQLQNHVPEQFAVDIEGSVTIVSADSNVAIFPDVYLFRENPTREAQLDAVAIAPSIKVARAPERELEERWIEIVDESTNRVVTVIEILSPFNKVGKGFADFAAKRDRVLYSDTSWLEIDLLRGGKRPFALLGRELTDYYALAGHSDSYEFDLWEMPLQQSLPIIGVPLPDGYHAVPLDLQAVVDKVYADGRYARKLKYDGDVPAPKLSAETEQWVRQQIATWRENLKHDAS